MQQWEYMTEMVLSVYCAERDLNRAGRDGWELVGIYREDGSWYAVFKRPKSV